MKALFVVAVAASLVCGATTPVQAQTAEPSAEALQAARELNSVISVGGLSELSANLSGQSWPGLEKMLRSRNQKIDDATVAELRREFERLQFTAVVELMNELVPIYARNFTVEEMRAITAFYRTPAGAKAMSIMPRLTVELFAAMGPRMQEMQNKMGQTFVETLQRKGLVVR